MTVMRIEIPKDDKTEMMKLVNSILSDPEMHKMKMATNSGRAGNDNNSLPLRGVRNDIINVEEMNNSKPMLKK